MTTTLTSPPLIRMSQPAPIVPQSHWLDWLDACRAEYGDIFTLEVTPEHRVTVLGHPDGLDHVLRQHAEHYPRVPIINAMLRRYLGDSFFTADGPAAQTERGALQPALMAERLHQQVGFTQDLIEAFIRAQSTVGETSQDLSDWTFRLTMTVALGSIFGLSYEQISPLLNSHQAAFRQVSQDYTDWASSWGDTPLWKPSQRHWAFLVARYRAYSLMKQLTQMALTDAASTIPQLNPSAMVSTWLAVMPKTQHRQLLTKAWQDRLRSLFSASFESLSSALTWSIVLLDQHTEARNNLIDEVTSPKRQPVEGIEGIRQFIWTKACFEESLRLYPPIYCLPRMSTQRDCINGHIIEPNTFLDCSLYLVQRNAAFWPEAHRFRPERFMPDSPIPAARQAYMPFGHGQHHCMGSTMAMLQGPLMLANLYRSFDISLEQPVTRAQCSPKMLLQITRPTHIRITQR